MFPPQRGVAILGVGNIEGMWGNQQAQTCARACVLPPAARPPFLAHFWTKNAQNRHFGGKKTPLRGISQQSLATWVGKNTPWGPWGGPGGAGRPAGRPAGRNFDFFLVSPKWPKKVPQGPRGPWGALGALFCPIWAPPWGGPWGGPGGALGPPYFPLFALKGCCAVGKHLRCSLH